MQKLNQCNLFPNLCNHFPISHWLIIRVFLLLFSLSLGLGTWDLGLLSAQSRIIINNGGYAVMNGGTSSIPIYLFIKNSNPNAITRNTSGHIISEGEYNKIQWNVGTTIGTYTFPFGKSTTAYIPFVFDKTTAGTQSGTGIVRVSSWYTANNTTVPTGTNICGQESNAIDRFWVIDVNGYSANPVATIRFYYDDPTDLDGLVEADLQAQRWNTGCCGGCDWETPPVGTVNVTDNYVEVAAISNFSPWVLANKNDPLPIELLKFTAQWQNKEQTSALLQWKTASEINNDYFEIQRSNSLPSGGSGWAFETIGTKQGAGNSSTILNYEYVDNFPSLWEGAGGWVYYRLKQVDYDGAYTYSNIEALNTAPYGINLIAIYPNPSSEYIDYLVYSAVDAAVSVMVLDAAGKLIISEKQQIKKGVNQHRLNTSYLSSGNYILLLTADENTKTEKHLVIK